MRTSPRAIARSAEPTAPSETLLARSADGQAPATAHQLYEAFGAKKQKKRLKVDDALDRLQGDGLIDRRGGRAIASDVALRLDELLTFDARIRCASTNWP